MKLVHKRERQPVAGLYREFDMCSAVWIFIFLTGKVIVRNFTFLKVCSILFLVETSGKVPPETQIETDNSF